MGNHKMKKSNMENKEIKQVQEDEVKFKINIPELESLLFSLTDNLKENQHSDKETKIDIYTNIRKVIDTMYYSEEYHLNSTFMWLND
jgi:hypothetical protein